MADLLLGWMMRAWGNLPREAVASILLALVGLTLALPGGARAPAEAEAALRAAGRRKLRAAGFALCLIGGLFLTIGAEAATVTATESPAGLFLGAALFAAAGFRCLWLAGR
ncbi:hypothetical protein ACI6QG_02220 [Roseococcus sp. DSY-14]|uniref:hypothetical protein n=1 Tax=Roseococcus sp. DSY-14 TaxID=3369650 RepID=UPI00387AFE56